MKANVPRAWQSLPNAQRKSIEEYCQRVAREAAMEASQKDARTALCRLQNRKGKAVRNENNNRNS